MDVRRQSFAVIALDCWLPAAPPAVWPFISDPDRMNTWSTAPVQGWEVGDGGGFGTVGALRRVVLPRPLPLLTEAVQYADAPSRFVYRAVGSRAIRYHRGEIRLTPDGGGTRLGWQFGMSLAMPGAEAFVRRTLGPQLEASLDRLATVVDTVVDETAGSSEPQPRDFRDDRDPAVVDAAYDTAQRLRVLADQMHARNDARHWFTRVYQYVTEAMTAACARGEVAHPTWALRLIPRFHDLYVGSLDDTPEPHWQEAFDAIVAASGDTASAALPFWRALVAGARAHIEGDLPHVLAAVYAEHYRSRCDYQRFRADFLLLAAPLQQAWQRLATQIPARWFPPHLRVLDRLLPAEALEHLTARHFYDPLVARHKAFEHGRALAASDAAPKAAPSGPPPAGGPP